MTAPGVGGETNAAWGATFLARPTGIPAHDTVNRVFAARDPAQVRAGFAAGTAAVAPVRPAHVLAVEGKTVRGAPDRFQGTRARHRGSAWASRNQLVRAPVHVDDNSHAIPAIPDRLRGLARAGGIVTRAGGIVTRAALGCQRDSAPPIRDQEAASVVALTAHQPDRLAAVGAWCPRAEATGYAGGRPDGQETRPTRPGRVAGRQQTVITAPAHLAWWPPAEQHGPGFRALGRVQAERRDGTPGAAAPVQTRAYRLRRPMTARAVAAAVRRPWGIENRVHGVRAVTVTADHRRIRAGHAAEQVVVVRHLALTRLQHEPRLHGRSLKAKRLKAAWDNDYVLTVLSAL